MTIDNFEIISQEDMEQHLRYKQKLSEYYTKTVLLAVKNRKKAKISLEDIANSVGVKKEEVLFYEMGFKADAIIEHEYRKRGLL